MLRPRVQCQAPLSSNRGCGAIFHRSESQWPGTTFLADEGCGTSNNWATVLLNSDAKKLIGFSLQTNKEKKLVHRTICVKFYFPEPYRQSLKLWLCFSFEYTYRLHKLC